MKKSATLPQPLVLAHVANPATGATLPVIRPSFGSTAARRSERGDDDESHQLFTVAEAANVLSVSVQSIRLWIAKRRIGHVRIGRTIRVPKSEINRLINRGYVPPRPERGE